MKNYPVSYTMEQMKNIFCVCSLYVESVKSWQEMLEVKCLTGSSVAIKGSVASFFKCANRREIADRYSSSRANNAEGSPSSLYT